MLVNIWLMAGMLLLSPTAARECMRLWMLMVMMSPCWRCLMHVPFLGAAEPVLLKHDVQNRAFTQKVLQEALSFVPPFNFSLHACNIQSFPLSLAFHELLVTVPKRVRNLRKFFFKWQFSTKSQILHLWMKGQQWAQMGSAYTLMEGYLLFRVERSQHACQI